MKKKSVSIIAKQGALLYVLFLLVFLQGCKEPEVRLGDNFDGSVKWALQKAQPEIDNFASDARIYKILGAQIWKDGRLPANTGTWSFVGWSPSLKKICQVTVNYQGNTSKSIRDSENPPNTGSGSTPPAGWVNSTIIFASIPGQEITKNYAQLVAFNVASYPQAPNTAVWSINFAGGKNPLIGWDGQYFGTQF